jgi:F0F1-type ATP synthase delta subunit
MKLPVLVFGVSEIRRLKRELESLEEYLQSIEIRQPGTQPALPRLSRLLDALAAENQLNLLQEDDRKKLDEFLEHIEHKAPNIHISFASDPSSNFTAKIVTWLRANIHPHVMLSLGLQPTIAAGCIVRTDNHVFDFSLRERFTKQQAELIKSLESVNAPAPAAAPAVDPAAPAAAQPVAAAAPAPAVPAQGAPAA